MKNHDSREDAMLPTEENATSVSQKLVANQGTKK